MPQKGWSDSLNNAYAFFNSLPEAAQIEAKEGLADLAQEALRIQRSLAPERTGNLKNALTIGEAVSMLRVRVGYPDFKGGRRKNFYAIWMEYGRRAQTVWVNRLKVGARKDWRARIRRGEARVKVKPNDLVSRYQMRLKALPARPFVHVESRLENAIRAFENRFWDAALLRAGA